MATTATAMTPMDNRVLLGAIAAAVQASREDSDRGLFEAKRELVLRLAVHPVLIAVRDEQPVSEPGPQGGVMLAFTDDEAASAWVQTRHPAAGGAELVPSTELSKGDISRRRWMQWMSKRGARSIAVNTAGPLGSIVHADEVRTMRPRLLRRGVTIEAEHPWLEIVAREAERDRAGQVLDELTGAIDRDDEAAFERLSSELPDLNRIGSLLWAAQLQFLSGRHQVARGRAKDGFHQMVYGSFAWGRFGDPYRCTDGLLDAGGQLLGLGERGGEWRTLYLSELSDVLERLDTGYRERDAERLRSAVRQDS